MGNQRDHLDGRTHALQIPRPVERVKPGYGKRRCVAQVMQPCGFGNRRREPNLDGQKISKAADSLYVRPSMTEPIQELGREPRCSIRLPHGSHPAANCPPRLNAPLGFRANCDSRTALVAPFRFCHDQRQGWFGLGPDARE